MFSILVRFHASANAASLAMSCVFDSMTVSRMRRRLARSVDPVSVASTMASASTGGFTSVAPHENSTLTGTSILSKYAYEDGTAPGAERIKELGLDHHLVPAPATSEDVALLLAYEKGAELIVVVGAHFNLIEFLERNRSGMSSTFLTRLRVGEILVDAKGVSRLVSRRVGIWPLVLFAAAGLGALVVAVAVSPQLRWAFEELGLRLRDLLGF